MISKTYLLLSNDPINYEDSTGLSKDPTYGIKNEKDLPSGKYKERIIKSAASVNWAIMNDYNEIAKNHCGATAATNLALYFTRRGYTNLAVKNKKGQRSKRETFKSVHKYVKNGPQLFIARNTKKYFKKRGYNLKYSGANNLKSVKNAISKNRPVGILIAGPQWHWIICVGYREYKNGKAYMRVVNGWDNTTKKYYQPHKGAGWVSGTQYWIKK
jgi:hypothetical protein